MYETAVVSATEKCSLGAKIRKMSLQAYGCVFGYDNANYWLIKTEFRNAPERAYFALAPRV